MKKLKNILNLSNQYLILNTIKAKDKSLPLHYRQKIENQNAELKNSLVNLLLIELAKAEGKIKCNL